VRASGIQTLFTSTIPRLINFPEFKEAYVPPSLEIPAERKRLDLQRGWDDFLKELILPEETFRVIPIYKVLLVVGPAGHGKSRLTYELNKHLARDPRFQVLRVTLRKHCKFFDRCHPDLTRLDSVDFFLKSCKVKLVEGKTPVFLFDGFEKVCKLLSVELQRLFATITAKRYPLLVTTRPHASEQLKACFQVKIHKLYLLYSTNIFKYMSLLLQ